MQSALDGENTVAHDIDAAYFVEDGSYTLFKDSTHAVVGAFQTGIVLLILRQDGAHAS
jgi:hypothetical protein